jgi:hypothetical protein
MPPDGFEPKIPASGQRLTHTLDRAATDIGRISNTENKSLLLRGDNAFKTFTQEEELYYN